MSDDRSTPQPVLASVATPQASLPAGVCRPCARCERDLPAPRRGQRFCSSRCRWARWAADRQAQLDAQNKGGKNTEAALEAIVWLATYTLGQLRGRRG